MDPFRSARITNVSLGRRNTTWRPLADLLGRERMPPERLRERVERLDLPAADRALLLELLGLD